MLYKINVISLNVGIGIIYRNGESYWFRERLSS